jgi:hypothetical protein
MQCLAEHTLISILRQIANKEVTMRLPRLLTTSLATAIPLCHRALAASSLVWKRSWDKAARWATTTLLALANIT